MGEKDFNDFLKHLGADQKKDPKPEEKNPDCEFKSQVENYLHPAGLEQAKSHYPVKAQKSKLPNAGTKKKQIKPDRTLDLHGKTLREALSITEHEIKRCSIQNKSILLVITGKGIHSPGKPVLKTEIGILLKNSYYITEVLPAPKQLGGSGAWVAKIRPSGRQENF